MRLSIHRVFRRLGRRFGRKNLLPARSATTDAFGLIPALYTEHLEFRVEEPWLRRRAIEGTQSVLAAQAPGIGTSRVRIIAPEKADGLAAINSESNVLTDQSDTFATVERAENL